MSCFFPQIEPFGRVKQWVRNNSCWIKLLVIVLLSISLVFNVYQYKIIDYYKASEASQKAL